MFFKWPPPKRSVKLTVVLPASNLSVKRSLEEKTWLAGQIARSLAIFRVSELIIFKDPEATKEDTNLLKLITDYLLIPPYLRKKLVPLMPELKFAGILYPLNIFTHNPEGREPGEGDVREGIILSSRGSRGTAYVGVKEKCYVRSEGELTPGSRVLVRITSRRPLRGEVVSEDSVDIYVGFKTKVVNSVRELLGAISKQSVVIHTSKYGRPYSSKALKGKLMGLIKERGAAVLLFGTPKHDLVEIVGSDLKYDFNINFIPFQGVYSVRTLEALNATLSQLNSDFITYKVEKPFK